MTQWHRKTTLKQFIEQSSHYQNYELRVLKTRYANDLIKGVMISHRISLRWIYLNFATHVRRVKVTKVITQQRWISILVYLLKNDSYQMYPMRTWTFLCTDRHYSRLAKFKMSIKSLSLTLCIFQCVFKRVRLSSK